MKQRVKKIITILVIAALSVVVLSPASVFAEETFPATIQEVPLGVDLSGKTVILHSNDVHGAIDGYAQMSQLGATFESLGAEVFLVDAGDYVQGDPYVGVSNGADAITMMNEAGYDLATIGNHEFDYGVDQLETDISKAEFPIICANVFKDNKLFLEPRKILTAKSGVKIGFFGLDTQESQSKANPNRIKGISLLGGEDMAKCAQEQIDELHKEGADLVIGLTHLGVDEESAPDSNRSSDLYPKISGVDLLIDGHSHTVMTEGANGEPIQSTGTKFAYIGVVVIDENGKIEDHYLISTEGLPSNDTVEDVANKIKEAVDKEYAVVFAKSEVTLDGERNDNRSQETNNGDFTTDALLWFANQHQNLINVPMENVVALENAGDTRDEIPEGDVMKENIIKVHPFGDTVCIISTTGEELLEVLEASTFCTPEPIGGFPQTAGIEFTLDTTKPYDQGELYPDSTYFRPNSIQRVSIQSINGKPFDPKAEYNVVAINFVASGGDTMHVFGQDSSYDSGVLLTDVLIDYIEKELSCVIPADKYAEPRGSMTIILDPSAQQQGGQTEDPGQSAGTEGTGQATDPQPGTGGLSPDGTYIVKPGDCLWNIATQFYGNGAYWYLIYDLNTGQIINPALIYPGQVLYISAAS